MGTWSIILRAVDEAQWQGTLLASRKPGLDPQYQQETLFTGSASSGLQSQILGEPSSRTVSVGGGVQWKQERKKGGRDEERKRKTDKTGKEEKDTERKETKKEKRRKRKERKDERREGKKGI